eukprot:TRINITY_DN12755_c0_g1_i2.p3 TRINITY_DN12755_c0_g1~~TRINITY_DN12755_c0_g1_i2.p3  ORF type:complete len:120 (+),score=13.94 TRINITY_DN12755_c0_g1_i2:87-446(+)
MQVLQLHYIGCHNVGGLKRDNRKFVKLQDGGISRNYCLGGGQKEEVVINKTPVLIESQTKGLSLDLYKYLLDHTREPEILARARIETAKQFGAGSSQMQVTPEQAQFLAIARMHPTNHR